MLRSRPARATVALGLVAGMFLTLAAEYVLLVWLINPVAFLGVLAAAIAAPAAAIAVWRGNWSPGLSGTAQQIAVAVVAVTLAGYAVLAVSRAIDEHRVGGLGVPTESEIGPWLVLGAAALASLAVLVAAAPRWLPRPATMLVAAVALLGSVAALVTAATAEAGVSCADARLDRATWRAALRDDRHRTVTDGERISAAIVDCGLLDGRSRDEVRRLLGPPYPEGMDPWSWLVGWVNDGLGPGDGQELTVHFDGDGRVTRATLTYPGD